MRRRENLNLEPIRVVAAHLVSRGLSASEGTVDAFAQVLNTARNTVAERSQQRFESFERREQAFKRQQKPSVSSDLSILKSKDAADLCARLDTLLREKSVLIAIA